MWRQIALAPLIAGAALFVACAAPLERPRFLESPLVLVPGQALMTPVDLPGAPERVESYEPPSLRLSDGRTLETLLVTLEPDRSTTVNSWLANNSTWRRTSIEQASARTLLLADVPFDALGLDLWVSGNRVPSSWIVPPLSEQAASYPLEQALTASQQATLLELVKPEMEEPRLRWRAMLALQRLGIESTSGAFADPALEAWAYRWQALAEAAERRLRSADAALADRWIEALTRCVRTSDAVLPMWPTNTEDITETILTLLTPEASDASVVRSAEAFLDRQPQWLSWVTEDAGGEVGGSMTVVNLSGKDALLSSRAPGGQWTAHGMLAPSELFEIPATTKPDSATTSVWQVRLGGRTRSLPITTGVIPLEPPGAAIGPFWHDWTLPGLQRSTVQSPAPGSVGWIGGLVHRDPRLERPLADASGRASYVEVHRPPCELPAPGISARSTDAIRVAFGPTEQARAELTIRCTGVTSVDSLGPLAMEGEPAIINKGNDRWAFTLPIDLSWLEPDGTILIGMQSAPAQGLRATWPRPLLPGQAEFGRVRIDPSAWGLAPQQASAKTRPPVTTRR